MFLRKQIQILSLNISICEIENMYRHTIVVNESLGTVINLAAQIEKIIEVFKCYYSSNDEIVSKQMVLFKMATEVFLANANMESLLRENDLKVSEIEREYVILQTVGTDEEMEQLTEKLKRFGLIEFIKSSRIALMKSSEGFCVEI
jgi:acetolactate synthase-1/3 small subunit